MELERLVRCAGAFVERGEIPMAVVGAAVSDEVVGIRAVGTEPDALVFVASITKPLVASLAMRMVVDGQLDLAAPLACRPELTAWHVLTHTSGLPEVPWVDALAALPASPAGFDAAQTIPLLFPPGTAVSYSTLAFELLGAELEAVTGTALDALLRRHVLEPLGMDSTTFDPGARWAVPIGHVQQGLPVSAAVATAHLIDLRLVGAGLWSTVEDLLRFGAAILASGRGDHDLLPSWAIDVMGTNQVAGLREHDGGCDADRGLGWRRGVVDGRRHVGNGAILEHDGAAGGSIWLDRDRDLAIVFLTSELCGSDRPWRQVVAAAYD